MRAERKMPCRACGLDGHYRCDGIVRRLEFGVKPHTDTDMRRRYLCDEAYCGRHIVVRGDYHYCNKHLNQRVD